MASRDIYPRSFDEDDGQTVSANMCTECGGSLRTESGETACTECGLLVDESRIAHDLGRPTYDDGPDREQTGAPLTPTRHDRGLSTEIGWGRDAKGNTLSARQRRQVKRIRIQHTRSRWQSKADQNLAHAFGEIQRLASALELPDSIQEHACSLFRTAQDANLLQGRSIESIAAASVYVACRCNEYACTVVEIGDVAGCSLDKVRHGYSVLNTELSLPIPVQQPHELLPRIASECGVSAEVRRQACEYAKRAEADGLANGRQPAGVAAASLYLAAEESGQTVRQTDIANVAGTSPVTLRARYHELSMIISHSD